MQISLIWIIENYNVQLQRMKASEKDNLSPRSMQKLQPFWFGLVWFGNILYTNERAARAIATRTMLPQRTKCACLNPSCVRVHCFPRSSLLTNDAHVYVSRQHGILGEKHRDGSEKEDRPLWSEVPDNTKMDGMMKMRQLSKTRGALRYTTALKETG